MISSQDELTAQRKFKIKYSQVQPSPKKNRYSEKKQIQRALAASSQLQVGPKNKKQKHKKSHKYQPVQTQMTSIPKYQRELSVQMKRKNSFSVDVSYNQKTDKMDKDKQYSRIPIQYFDERDKGSLADKVRGRVVYRGYAPKNTYFYLRTIKGNPLLKKETAPMRGEDITFNSKFESGNLHAAVKVSSKQYWLFMREDTNTHGLRQWFYFQAKASKKVTIKFRIYKYSKSFSLYKQGMKPFVKTISDQTWSQKGQQVKYLFDKEQSCYFLQFSFQFEDNEPTLFASLPPYSYSRMQDYIQRLKEQESVRVKQLGVSLCGLSIYTLSIKETQSQPPFQGKTTGTTNPLKKQAICIMARTHPGETNSNFALQGFINKLLLSNELLSKFDFHILPMVNPDGVFFGNHRTSIIGQDLNRNFNSELQYYPEVQLVQSWIQQIKQKQKICFLLDLHGHSARKNIFAYGEQEEIGSKKYLLSRILPKILSQTIDSFKYEYCIFRASKEKKNTARVFFSQKLKINCLTFEESYGMLDVGPIGIQNWKNFGAALIDALLECSAFIYNPNQAALLQQYLVDEMQTEKDKRQRRLQKRKQLILSQIPLKNEFKKDLSKDTYKELDNSSNIGNAKGQNLLSEYQERLAINRSCLEINTTENNGASYKNETSRPSKTQMEEQADCDKSKQQMLQSASLCKDQESSYFQSKGSFSHPKSSSSVDSEELSSGDQEMEMTELELQNIKKDIIRVRAQREGGLKRQIYNLADKRVELKASWANYEERLHNDKSSVVPRILKLQMKRKEQFLAQQSNNLFHSGRDSYSLKKKRTSIELPSIKRP